MAYTDYQTIRGNDAEFDSLVSAAILDGWRPYGSPSREGNANIQAMVKGNDGATDYQTIVAAPSAIDAIVTEAMADEWQPFGDQEKRGAVVVQRMVKGLKAAAGSGSGIGANGNLRIGWIGTSLIQNCMQPSAVKIANSSRGWISWARFFSKGAFHSPVWWDDTVRVGWEPGQVAGTSRYFNGLNAGVAGQTIAQIAARKEFLTKNVKCDLIVIDGGTNDISGSMTAQQIQAAREEIANYYLDQGIPVILLTILARDLAQWAAGSTLRQKAMLVNSLSREYVKGKSNCVLYDWNTRWATLYPNWVPKSGYSNDGTHMAPTAGVDIGEDFANFVKQFMPSAAPRVWAQDDVYNASNNPRGNQLANPFCTGTTGSLTNATGSVATSMRVNRQSGDATVVAGKVARSDGRGEWQEITITTGATDSEVRFQTSTANIVTPALAGEWMQASCEVEIDASADIYQVQLDLWDSTNGFSAIDMDPDTYSAPAVKWPNRALQGMLITPAMQMKTNGASMAWRVRILVDNPGSAATIKVRIGAVEQRIVDDPRLSVEYKAQ